MTSDLPAFQTPISKGLSRRDENLETLPYMFVVVVRNNVRLTVGLRLVSYPFFAAQIAKKN